MNTTKIQVPIDKDVRDGLERRAKELGFDSAQAYIRVWAKAEAEGRKLDFDSTTIILSPDANKRYSKMIDELDDEKNKEKIESFESVEGFMKDLRP
jgi:antitoxin component of RelBE/YafQ-DinJ toxin-antitoxin module